MVSMPVSPTAPMGASLYFGQAAVCMVNGTLVSWNTTTANDNTTAGSSSGSGANASVVTTSSFDPTCPTDADLDDSHLEAAGRALSLSEAEVDALEPEAKRAVKALRTDPAFAGIRSAVAKRSSTKGPPKTKAASCPCSCLAGQRQPMCEVTGGTCARIVRSKYTAASSSESKKTGESTSSNQGSASLSSHLAARRLRLETDEKKRALQRDRAAPKLFGFDPAEALRLGARGAPVQPVHHAELDERRHRA